MIPCPESPSPTSGSRACPRSPTEVYVYCGNAGAAETNDADTWNADYGVVYHLVSTTVKEDPARAAQQSNDSTANAVHGTYGGAGATVEDNGGHS